MFVFSMHDLPLFITLFHNQVTHLGLFTLGPSQPWEAPRDSVLATLILLTFPRLFLQILSP